MTIRSVTMLKKLSTIAISAIVLSGCQSVPSMGKHGNQAHVGSVAWNTTGAGYTELSRERIPTDQANLVFIRSSENMTDQSSANIALNDDYLVSLQGNHYTQSLVCSGSALISVQPTGEKSNDLKANGKLFSLQPQQTYYFHINVDKNNQPTIDQITADSAKQLLAQKGYQSHQISRVVNDCQAPATTVSAVPVKPVKTKIAPVQVAPVNVRLNVLFDHDKSVVKNPYQQQLAQLSEFLIANPDVTAVIEGHTDSNGDNAYNQRLSQRRADAVKNVLVKNHGIASNRLSTKGYGEERPVASNATAEGRQENRRVIVVVAQ